MVIRKALIIENRMRHKWLCLITKKHFQKEEIKIYFYTSLTNTIREDDEITKIERLKKDLTNRQ